jgi:hypothetical protein
VGQEKEENGGGAGIVKFFFNKQLSMSKLRKKNTLYHPKMCTYGPAV